MLETGKWAYVFVLLLCTGTLQAGRNKAVKITEETRLWAFESVTEGGIDLYGSGTQGTLHNWNSTSQRIFWTTRLRKGNYRVRMNCSQPAFGSAVTVTAGGQQLAALVKPTGDWQKYGEADLGVIRVERSGAVTVVLQGIQKGLEHAEGDSWLFRGAFPDVHYLVLEPTDTQADSSPTDILRCFKGRALFDGKSFDGWVPNNGEASMAWFRIEDGVIVGGSMSKDIPQNEFLRTDRTYGNFELRLKFKVDSTDNSYNGGIQFRSVPHTDERRKYEMIGYQADINSYVRGALYDEERRAMFLGTALDSGHEYYPGDWNEYIIRCEGPRVRIWLNRVQTLDYMEPYAATPCPGARLGAVPLFGYIALQIHYAKASEVRYKDIMIEELK